MNGAQGSLKRALLSFALLLVLSGCVSSTGSRTQSFSALTPKTAQLHTAPKAQSLDGEVSFEQAFQALLSRSKSLKIKQLAAQASALQAQAVRDLDQPMIVAGASAGYYQLETHLSTQGLRQRLHDYGAGLLTQLPEGLGAELGAGIGDGLGQLWQMQVPEQVGIRREDFFTRINLGFVAPIYSAGRIEAVQDFLGARAQLDWSEAVVAREDVLRLLVNRYFLVQLARSAVAVREEALEATLAHDYAAERMLAVGLIAKAQRLQGKVALSEARLALEKARDDLHLAEQALAALLSAKIKPSTGLFVDFAPLEPVHQWQARARAHYPALQKITAKKNQALALKQLSEASWSPTLSAFGLGSLSDGAHSWAVGVQARWLLHSPLDRQKMNEAADLALEQVFWVEAQALEDVDLLVEKNWLTLSQAQQRFIALKADEALAHEALTLTEAGFREGLNTVIELNDAQARVAKIKTQQMQAAYDYVQALAELLAATGDLDKMQEYIERAEVRLPVQWDRE